MPRLASYRLAVSGILCEIMTLLACHGAHRQRIQKFFAMKILSQHLCIIVLFVLSSENTSQPVHRNGGKTKMTQTFPPNLTLVTYHRIYVDPRGDSHFDTVTVKQSLACAAPPAAPFYVSEDKPASKIASIRFSPAG